MNGWMDGSNNAHTMSTYPYGQRKKKQKSLNKNQCTKQLFARFRLIPWLLELDQRLLQVVQRPLHQTLVGFEVIEQVVPQRVFGQHLQEQISGEGKSSQNNSTAPFSQIRFSTFTKLYTHLSKDSNLLLA
jgi:hypothetical protein